MNLSAARSQRKTPRDRVNRRPGVAAATSVIPSPVVTVADGWGPCPSWCEDTGVHSLSLDSCDRMHYGPQVRCPLPLEPAVEMVVGDPEPDYLVAYLQARAPCNYPTVFLGRGEGVGVTMRLEDAELLAAVLDGLVKVARRAAAETATSAAQR